MNINNQRGFANLIVIGVVLVVVLGVGGYFVLVRKPATPTETQQPITPPSDVTVTQTPPTIIPPQPTEASKNIYTNKLYGLQFTLPDGYFVGSDQLDETDPTKARSFSFFKENSYRPPVLSVTSNLKLLPGQTLQQLALSIYKDSKNKNYINTTDLKSASYDGVAAYEFSFDAFYTKDGIQYPYYSNGKTVLLYHNGVVFQFLQKGGADSGLTDILDSLKFK